MFYNLLRLGLFLTMFISIGCFRKQLENLDDHPFAVSITIKANGVIAKQCTGAIVSENYVLTSWICIRTTKMKDVLDGYIRAGADIIDTDGEIHPIKKIERSIYANWYDYNHNIAMLLVDNLFDYTTHINEVPLNGLFVSKDGEEVKVVGFMSESDESKKKLHSFNSVIVPYQGCSNYLWRKGFPVKTGMICIGRTPDPQLCDLAQGAVLLHKNKLIGVLTFRTKTCSNQDDPIVFTLISKYLSWLNWKTDPHIFNETVYI